MTIDKKAARLDTGTASNTASDSRHSTKTDPLTGWYSLGAGVKSGRTERTPKRGWKRNNKGRIDPLLALYLGLMVLAALMILGGGNA
jgi:hypothetical protein